MLSNACRSSTASVEHSFVVSYHATYCSDPVKVSKRSVYENNWILSYREVHLLNLWTSATHSHNGRRANTINNKAPRENPDSTNGCRKGLAIGQLDSGPEPDHLERRVRSTTRCGKERRSPSATRTSKRISTLFVEEHHPCTAHTGWPRSKTAPTLLSSQVSAPTALQASSTQHASLHE